MVLPCGWTPAAAKALSQCRMLTPQQQRVVDEWKNTPPSGYNVAVLPVLAPPVTQTEHEGHSIITKSRLCSLLHLSEEEAAESVRLPLKRFRISCRKFDIMRWPGLRRKRRDPFDDDDEEDEDAWRKRLRAARRST